ncbi:MAG: hypothetical protein ACFFBC_15300 [Promethearchaeota archaeon]
MEKLFTYPEEFRPLEVSIFRTTKYRTFSRREKGVEADLDARVKHFSDAFKIDGKPNDLGERIIIQDERQILIIYRASDSLLLLNKKNGFRTSIPEGTRLPEQKEAYEIATNYLDQVGLSTNFAKFKSFTYSKGAMFKAETKQPTLINSEAHVNFDFSLENIPVIGPGAKIKVSIVEGDEVSGLIYYWRTPSKEETIPIIEPREALKRLTADKSFKELSPDTASVKLYSITLGYYAMSPTDFQRFLVPVYAIKGTVETKFLDPYNFTQHVVAVDMSLEEIKRRGVVDNPYKCLIF